MTLFIPNPLANEIAKLMAAPHIEEVAQEGESLAKRLAPVDTGALQESIHVEDADEDHGKRVVVDVPYWAYVEFGTSVMPAQPFLRPIIDDLGLHR